MPRHLAARLLRHVRDDAPDAVDLLDDRELNARGATLTRRPPGSDVGCRAAVDDQPSRRRLVERRCEAGPPVRRIHLPPVGGHPVARPQRSELGRDDHDVARRAARQRRDVERGVQDPGVEPGGGRRRRLPQLFVEQPVTEPRQARKRQTREVDRLAARRRPLPLARRQQDQRRSAAAQRARGEASASPPGSFTPAARTGDAGRARSRRDP